MEGLDKLKEFKWLIISGMILMLSILLFVMASQQNKSDLPNEIDLLDELLSSEDNEHTEAIEPESEESFSDSLFVLVDVKGAVENPGVYQLEGSSRVIDAIHMAGGLREEAITSNVNFAKQLVDEMLIYIPVEGEEITPTPLESEPDLKNQKININTASTAELETLSGIGPQKAQEIVRYREEEGNFKTIEELTSVSGIGDKTFEKLKDIIMVD